MSERRHKRPLELLGDGRARICAPMVRYSKLPFRTLVREYGCDLAFTPMIMANSFVNSEKARSNEFKTNEYDRPLITQFAANNAEDFAGAAELVSRFCDGVDLNCGCPQSFMLLRSANVSPLLPKNCLTNYAHRPSVISMTKALEIKELPRNKWAMQDCCGAYLLGSPNTVKDMVQQTWNRLSVGREEFTVSLKIRIHSDLQRTVELCRRAEMVGVSFITVHGRTKDQQKEPVDVEAVRLLSTSVRCPVVANGDVTCLSDFDSMLTETGAKGVMIGRGLLSNPALFAGYEVTPVDCIRRWLAVSLGLGTAFIPFHQHLIYMCDKLLPRAEKRVFNVLNGVAAVLDYLDDRYDVTMTDPVKM